MWLLGYSGWLPRCPEQSLISYVVARVFWMVTTVSRAVVNQLCGC